MEMSEIIIAVLFTAIAVVVALAIYPTVHNAIDTCTSRNASNYQQCYTWSNTTPITGIESAMLNLIVLIFPAAIALTPIGLLYLMSKR
jgi:hypothetical protein